MIGMCSVEMGEDSKAERRKNALMQNPVWNSNNVLAKY